MIVELISVGTEILMGNIVNTNAAFLAEQCASMGLVCYYQTTVGDNEKRLLETVNTAMDRADLIILSGGLGPTGDDITKEVCAKATGRKLVMDGASRVAIEKYFEKMNRVPTDNNWKQAQVPEGCIVMHNDNGTAPGMIIEHEKATLILLPGPPGELIPMFNDSVKPYISGKQEAVMVSQTVKIVGMGESAVAAAIADLFDSQTNPTIATYAKTGEVHLRVTARAEDEKKARKLLKPMIKDLKERFNEHIYTTDPEITLEEAVVELLVNNELTVSTVESCTGGLVAGRLINVSGVSEVFKMGHITYSNKAKRKIIGVKRSTLDKYGAVSEQVAREMAKGGALLSKSDVVVSITGIAGPDGGSETKPVGLVYIGCCVKGNVRVQEYHFSGNRAKIRASAVAAALVLIRECVLEYVSQVTFGKKK